MTTYTVPNLYLDMIDRPHLLIAGATGSGKSVAINGLIYAAMAHYGAGCGFILIDPKRVELAAYRTTKQCIRYASEPADMIQALKDTVTIIDNRYKALAAKGKRRQTTGPIYVVIDELADLMATAKREVQPLLQRICQIGRAANVHVIAATQCPLAKIIPTEIKVNFDYRLGLRMAQPQHSRNLLDMTCCETLPPFGQGFYQTPLETKKYIVPMIPEKDLTRICRDFRKGFFALLRSAAAC